jgi:hypothetical protein
MGRPRNPCSTPRSTPGKSSFAHEEIGTEDAMPLYNLRLAVLTWTPPSQEILFAHLSSVAET